MTLQVGDRNETVRLWRQRMNDWFGPLYTRLLGPLPTDTDQFGPRAKSWQEEYERRTGQPVDGVVSDTDLLGLRIPVNARKNLPLFVTAEGHQSDMFRGPVADTATFLEREGRCHHLPTWYNNGAIPFDNQSLVNELARRLGQTVQDNGVPSPAGTPILLGGFSQGMIGMYDFLEQYMMPGKPLAWRMKDFIGGLWYGNPCRGTDSIAAWAVSGIKKRGTHGLDPYKRFGAPGCVPTLPNTVDVYRGGDIFAENGDDQSSQMKAAVYEAVARGKFIGSPITLAAKIAGMFTISFDEVLGVVLAIVSGISFLGDNPNPHYSPYDISGGLDWARSRLEAA